LLNRARRVVGTQVSGQEVASFLKSLTCSNGGRHGYFRALRCFYNWIYSQRSGYRLNPQDNPMLFVEAPKLEKKILPSLTLEQLESLIDQAECTRDKAIISLFADSGLRLMELSIINPTNIDWDKKLIKVKCKGGKEALAPFGTRTEKLLKEWLSRHTANGRLWDISYWGINIMLCRLKKKNWSTV